MKIDPATGEAFRALGRISHMKLTDFHANYFAHELTKRRTSDSVKKLAAMLADARAEIESLLDAKVFLELWVKVWKNWRRDPRAIRTLGYQGR